MVVNPKTVRKIMRLNGLHGLPGPRKGFRTRANIATAPDLVERRFDRPAPDQLWVTDITEHPTREGKLYCCVVLDVFSRRVVGWSIDTHQAAPLVTNALGMAIHNRNPRPEQTVIHSDHALNPGSSPPGRSPSAPRDSGLLPSMGTIGDAFDNARDRVLLGSDADRAAGSPSVEYSRRAGQRDL